MAVFLSHQAISGHFEQVIPQASTQNLRPSRSAKGRFDQLSVSQSQLPKPQAERVQPGHSPRHRSPRKSPPGGTFRTFALYFPAGRRVVHYVGQGFRFEGLAWMQEVPTRSARGPARAQGARHGPWGGCLHRHPCSLSPPHPSRVKSLDSHLSCMLW